MENLDNHKNEAAGDLKNDNESAIVVNNAAVAAATPITDPAVLTTAASTDSQTMHSPIDWPQYFISLAYMVAMKSKDPSTKVGAVIVGPDNEIRSTGYNGLPRGVGDYSSLYHNREYKYIAGNHAEENAIINASLVGVSLKGCTLYSPWFPCAGCARMIIQSGITAVVYHQDFPGHNDSCLDHWKKSIDISRQLLTESGVDIRAYCGDAAAITVTYQGKKFDHLLQPLLKSTID